MNGLHQPKYGSQPSASCPGVVPRSAGRRRISSQPFGRQRVRLPQLGCHDRTCCIHLQGEQTDLCKSMARNPAAAGLIADCFF